MPSFSVHSDDLTQRGRLNPEFSPQPLNFWFETLFTGYRIAKPDRPRITADRFRKTSFTKAWAAGIVPREASIAIGCNVDTMVKHYVQIDEQEMTHDVSAQLTVPAKKTAPGGIDWAIVGQMPLAGDAKKGKNKGVRTLFESVLSLKKGPDTNGMNLSRKPLLFLPLGITALGQ
jgi:hypothetical protein